MIYLLFYCKDSGDREDWNVYYTPVEAFSTPALRDKRIQELALADPDLEFETCDVELDKPD